MAIPDVSDTLLMEAIAKLVLRHVIWQIFIVRQFAQVIMQYYVYSELLVVN